MFGTCKLLAMEDYEFLLDIVRTEASAIEASSAEDLAGKVKDLVYEARTATLRLAAHLEMLGLYMGDSPEDIYRMLWALLPDDLGRTTLYTDDPGHPVSVELDELPSFNRRVRSLAEAYGVSDMDIARFRRMTGFDERYRGTDGDWIWSGATVSTPCSHSETCPERRAVVCKNPRDLVEAERYRDRETWFCEMHRASGWERLGKVADVLIDRLEDIRSKQPCTLAESRLTKDEMVFLQECGLISVKPVMRGTRVVWYEISTTAEGDDLCARRRELV